LLIRYGPEIIKDGGEDGKLKGQKGCGLAHLDYLPPLELDEW
jgi:hypothetical protein